MQNRTPWERTAPDTTRTARAATAARPAAAWSALLALLATLLIAAAPGAGALEGVVVRAAGSLHDAAAAVTLQGGRVEGLVSLADSVIADVPAHRLDELVADPRVAQVVADHTLTVQSDSFDEVTASPVTEVIRAGDADAEGLTGAGIGVALLDTGVDMHHPDLDGRVVAWADLTRDADGQDRFGHGTFMAGVIAGDGSASDGRFRGVAPDVHLVSIKVAGADGSTTLGQVLHGLEIIHGSRDTFDTRVVLIALAGPDHPGPDPLELALERLWADGLVVVTAAGNADEITSPGADPYVITAGALDDAGSVDAADDSVPAWSGRGPTADGIAKPDLLAPGVSVVAARAAGSSIDEQNAHARIGDAYLRGSGTSMAAAVTAGGAALLLEADAALNPDLVKGRLLGSAAPAPQGADPTAVGHGVLDVAGAVASTAGPANQDLPPLAPMAPVHGGEDHERGQRGQRGGPTSEPTASQWAVTSWAASQWAASQWAASQWAASQWAASQWAASQWAASQWAASQWAASQWAASQWAASQWAASQWAASQWAASSWAASSWA